MEKVIEASASFFFGFMLLFRKQIKRGRVMLRSANQQIKPISTRINEKKHLEIGGCDIEDLVSKYGTPLYIFDEKTIRTIAKDWKEALKSYPNHKLLFASIVFMTKAMCKIIQSEGFGLDLVL